MTNFDEQSSFLTCRSIKSPGTTFFSIQFFLECLDTKQIRNSVTSEKYLATAGTDSILANETTMITGTPPQPLLHITATVLHEDTAVSVLI